MPLSTSDVLDAYRADLSNAGKSRFSDRDAAWLAFGTLLQRAVSLPVGDRAAYLRSTRATVNAPSVGPLSDVLDEFERKPSPDALSAVVMSVAAEVEDAGAFALATAMLDFGRILVGLSEFRLQGRLLAHQARILRKIGEADLAHELYDQVAEIGETHGDRELIARAQLGRGVLARVRGNYPAARREFLAVLEVEASSDAIRELRVHAHQGLLIVSAIAGDFDAAIKHGAAAVAGATDEQLRVVLLQNLASVCYDAGQFRSALHGQLQALAATQMERVRLPALGGAAVAAARLGEAQIVEELVEAAAPLLRQRAPEFELADMIREFAEAYGYLGDVERWRRFRDEALARAERGKFFEIVHRIESMRTPTAVPPPEIALTRDALAVAARLASGDSGELLTAAVGGGRSDSHSR